MGTEVGAAVGPVVVGLPVVGAADGAVGSTVVRTVGVFVVGALVGMEGCIVNKLARWSLPDVGLVVGATLGVCVVGLVVGCGVGLVVGVVGPTEGALVGVVGATVVGAVVGTGVGKVGPTVGDMVGAVGAALVGLLVGTFAIQMTLQVSKVPPGTHSHVLVAVGSLQSTPDEQQWWPSEVACVPIFQSHAHL